MKLKVTMNHDKGWTPEDEQRIPDVDAYTPKEDVTVQSCREEIMSALCQYCVFGKGYEITRDHETSSTYRHQFLGLLKFAVNSGLISKLEFNQFQRMNKPDE